MEKRYQVFVSSTYQDLQHERQEVMHALLELDCIPSGMELFPAANESQWELIKKVIEDCGYHILIIGGRYGSIGPDGISYTEMEYRYALLLGKPTIAFLHKEPGKIEAERSEANADGKEKLKAFRESAQKKLCKFWSSPQELGSVVSRGLVQLIKNTPAVGWIRADELPDKDAAVKAEFFDPAKFGNIFWVGHDLVTTMVFLLTGRSRERILEGLYQSKHHLSEVGFHGTIIHLRLERLYTEAEKSSESDWTDERRQQVAQKLEHLARELGGIIAPHQIDFKSHPAQ